MNENEDDKLRALFHAIPLGEVSGGFTSKVMEQVVNKKPVEELAGSRYFEWWWIPVSVLGVAALYFTGTGSLLLSYILPWLDIFYIEAIKLAGSVSEIFPSNKIAVPSASLVPVIAIAVIFALLFDLPLQLQHKKASGQ